MGPIDAWAEDQRLPLGGPRQLALLAFLVLHANRAVSADALIDTLWGPEREGAGKRLQMAIARLRQALAPLSTDGEPLLRTVKGGYLLSVAPEALDAEVFQAWMREGQQALRAGDPARACDRLGAALGLWRGPALAEVAFEDFAQPDIRRLEELRAVALETRIEADLQRGRHEELIGELELLLAQEPTRERLAGQLMLALYRSSRQADALDVYHRTRVRLVEEHGLEPSPALRALQAQILEQSIELEIPAGTHLMTVRASIDLLSDRTAHAHREPSAGGGVLLERERELRVVGELLGLAGGGSGRLLVVAGVAGIGKTGLLAAALEQADGYGFHLCRATATELEHDLPWGVVREVFADVVRAARGSDPGVLEGAAGLALPVLGLGTPEVGGEALGAALHGLYWLMANLSERGPVFVGVDDVQWADAASMRFLHYLSARLGDLPVLVMVALRRGEPGAWEREAEFESVPGAVLLEPSALSVEASHRLLEGILGRGVEPGFARACQAATGGNPFLLRELGGQLAVDGIAPVARSASLVRGVSVRSVSHWILLRLGRLPEGGRRLAEAVAVFGGRVELALAAALAELDVEQAGRLADALWDAGMLAPGVPLEFVHPLVRAAVYAEIPPLARHAAHGRAARLVADEGGDLDAAAAHLLQTKPVGDPYVVETLSAAAASARRRGAPDEATIWLHRALEEPPAPQDRVAVLLQLGRAEATVANPAAIDHFHLARQLVTDPGRRAQIALMLASVMADVSRFRDAFELARRALIELRDRDRELELQLRAFLTMTRWMDNSVVRTCGDPPRLPAAPPGRTFGERMVLIAVAANLILAGGKPVSDGSELIRRALEDGEFLGDRTPTLQFWQAIALLQMIDELALAERLESVASTTARRRGSLAGLAAATTWQTHGLLRKGLIRDVTSDLEFAERFGDDVWPPGMLMRIHVRMEALLAQGRLNEAALEAAKLHPASADSLFGRAAIFSRGRLQLVRGQFNAALADFRLVASDDGARNPGVLSWRSPAALALAGLGRSNEASAMLAEEHELARASGMARATGVNLRTAGLLERGNRKLELLRESVGVLEGCPSVLERAYSLVELGSALRRAGRRAESLPCLGDGLALAEEAGATVLVARARRELRDAGGRPHRPPRTGRDVLTPSELRVGRLAAEGASNKQIAQALFVSLRTVETHLTHAYAKLGIDARDKLAQALLEKEP